MEYPTQYQNQLNGLFDIFKPKKLLAKKVTSIVSKGKVTAPVAQKLMTAIAPITKSVPVPIPTMPLTEVKTVLNQIAMNNLGAPLTPSMLQQYTDRYTTMVNRVGKTSDQAFDEINAEFADATARMDTAFYESRTGQKLAQETSDMPSLPGGTVQTAGASGNSNLLVYGAIAAVAAYLVYNSNNSKQKKLTPASSATGLSGVRKRKSSRKPSSRTKTKKTTGSVRKKRTAAKTTKKSGRVHTINL